MGKKKWKKKQRQYYGGPDISRNKKSKKNKNKNRGLSEATYNVSKSELKTMRPSLPKAKIKENREIIKSPVKVPKDFLENRAECNHVGRLISPAEFKRNTPTYSAYTPALDAMIAKYGEDHVHICSSCYDVVVDRDCVSADDVLEAMVTLYAAANVAVSNYRMKRKEIRKVAKKKDVFDKYQNIVDILTKIEESDMAATATSGNSRSINGTPAAAYIG